MHPSTAAATLLLVCVAASCVSTPASFDAGPLLSDAASADDVHLAMQDAPIDERLVVLTPVPAIYEYGAVVRNGVFGSTTPRESPALVFLGLWRESNGCALVIDGVDSGEVVTLEVVIRGHSIDETHDMPPTVGTYRVVPGRAEPLASAEAGLGFDLIRDGMFVDYLESVSGTLTIESMTSTDLTLYVDAILEGEVRVRGRVTLGHCGPPP